MNQVRNGFVLLTVLLLLIASAAAPAIAVPPELVKAAPESAGMDSGQLAHIDDAVAAELAAGRLPGCVVLVDRHGQIVFHKAYGFRRLQPEKEVMTTDTIFDMASLTKPMATATSVMILVEQGRLRLRDNVARHWPDFGQEGKDEITVEQLLMHQGGLIADNSLDDYTGDHDQILQHICQLKPVATPGTKFIYSDVGFIVLGEIVHRVSGRDLNQFTHERIFEPLGMKTTGFLPSAELRSRAAPTEQREERWMQGEVHDPRAYRLGGVAGHAGLFSTAADVAIYGQMMLGRGQLGDASILSPASVAQMTTRQSTSSGFRGLGWDMQSDYSSNRGELFSPRAFGHGGFTGTSLWIDPELDLCVIFLSNRVHPDGKGSVNPLAGRIGTIAAAAIDRTGTAAEKSDGSSARAAGDSSRKNSAHHSGHVLTGIDVVQRDGFALLKGRRVGLITNHTGVNRDGISTVELLRSAPEVELVALFSPEHGFEGKVDAKVDDSRDARSNLPIFSLYGKTQRPTDESLRGIDTLVFDLQDVGTRFYTYLSTMGEAMQAAAEHKLRFIVLDRPNPIGGLEIAGPLVDAGQESFVAFHRVPVRYGMTVGELARMFSAERKLSANLHVVPIEGWRRENYYDATGLVWINPSPNMRSLTEALLYPGVGLLETTNVSVGRGTDTPFEVVGAPWIDARALAAALNVAGLKGVRFVPIEFTPQSSAYAKSRCNGVNIVLTDRAVLEPVRMGLTIAVQLRALYPHEWKSGPYVRLLGNARVVSALEAGQQVSQLEALWKDDLAAFRERRKNFLLYP